MLKRTKYFMLITLSVLLPFVAAAQGVNLKNGLVAYYPFESNASDRSGNENNGSVKGATLREGIMGNCYHFGGYDDSQFIKVLNSNSLKFDKAASFSLWFKVDQAVGMDGYGSKSNTPTMCFFAKDYDRGYLYALIHLEKDNELNVSVGIDDKDLNAKTSGDPLKWHHLGVVLTTSRMAIYLDGNPVASKDVSLSFNGVNTKDLYFGRFSTNWYPLLGCLDEVRIYNRALTREEVSALYKNTSLSEEVASLGSGQYKDVKLLDDDPDYKVYEDVLDNDLSGVAFDETNQMLYALDGSRLVVAYDFRNVMNKDVSKRYIQLPFSVETKWNTMEVSPNGKYLAFIDADGAALHIISTDSGNEIATEKFGPEYALKKAGDGRPFNFVSDNEVLAAGHNNAMLYNIQKRKAKKLPISQLHPHSDIPFMTYVSPFGHISTGYFSDANNYNRVATFVLENGKITNRLSHTYTWGRNTDFFEQVVYNSDGKIAERTLFDLKTGNKISLEEAFSDRHDYKWNFPKGEFVLTDKYDSNKSLSFPARQKIWFNDFKGLIIWSGKTMRVFNHTLTGAEIEKQQLLTAIDSKSPKNIEAFIQYYPDSRYQELAKEKRMESIKRRGKDISKPANFSYAHANELKNYIKDYGDEVDVSAAQNELDNLYKNGLAAIGSADVDGFNKYIKDFPESPYLAQAQQKQKNAEKEVYNALMRSDDLNAYNSYIAKYPDSPYITKVKERQSALILRQKEAEEQRRQEALRAEKTAKLNSVGKTIYWDAEVSFDISSGGDGLLMSMIKNAAGLNTVTYTVRYYAIVESVIGQSAVKCIISKVQIQDPSFASANYLKYRSKAQTSLNDDIGKTRVLEMNDFRMK